MEVILLQLSNACPLIVVTVLGMDIDVTPVHAWKAHAPMLVMPLEIVIDSSPAQPSKVYRLISDTSDGITKFLISSPFRNKCLAEIRGLELAPKSIVSQALRSSINTAVIWVQLRKAFAPIVVILLGMNIDFKPDPKKPFSPMDVTLKGKDTDVNE